MNYFGAKITVFVVVGGSCVALDFSLSWQAFRLCFVGFDLENTAEKPCKA